MDYIKSRRRKFGESRWVSAVSRPDICPRLARIASRINALCGSDVKRNNELARVVEDWQQATVLKFASPSQPRGALGWGDKVQGAPLKRGERIHGGSTTVVGWSDSVYGYQSTEGKCRSGYVIGFMSSTLKGPCHTFQWTPTFTRKLVRSSLGGEV